MQVIESGLEILHTPEHMYSLLEGLMLLIVSSTNAFEIGWVK